MPRAYSLDLRTRVIAACGAGEQTRAEIADQFDVAETTLYDWLHHWRIDGTVAPRKPTRSRTTGIDRTVLGELVEEQNDRTLEEYVDAYEARMGRRYSISRMCTVLKELRLSRKGKRYAPRNSSSRTSRPSA
jgi:transposase